MIVDNLSWLQKRLLFITVGIPLLYAIFLRFLYGIRSWNEIFSVMSISFLVGLPLIVGALTVYLSDPKRVEKIAFRIFMPWIPVLFFFAITLTFSIEGCSPRLVVLIPAVVDVG